MDKTFGYYFEKFIGFFLGVTIGIFIFIRWSNNSALYTDKYYDLIMKVSASIFGFLLTLLALIINSSSKAVTEMREHGSYKRLINLNRTVVLLCLTIIIFSLLMILIVLPKESLEYFTEKFSLNSFKLIASLHSTFCVWCAIDTIIFIRIFYKIVLTHIK